MIPTPPDSVRRPHPTQDGAGVKIQRIHDFRGGLDPFLMLDELKTRPGDEDIGSFPDHPHRGFETLTYLVHGSVSHRDSMGNEGRVEAGGAQWMSAGRGVIHSETLLPDAEGLHGFQLWVNLPARRKMDPPRYRDVAAAEMQELPEDGGPLRFRAIAGSWQTSAGDTEGPLPQIGEGAAMADLALPAGHRLSLAVALEDRVLAYVFDGQLTGLEAEQMGVWHGQTQIHLIARQDARVLLFKGQPLGEPIAHYGPFVMNTTDEIEQAVSDYQSGRLAAEPAGTDQRSAAD